MAWRTTRDWRFDVHTLDGHRRRGRGAPTTPRGFDVQPLDAITTWPVRAGPSVLREFPTRGRPRPPAATAFCNRIGTNDGRISDAAWVLDGSRVRDAYDAVEKASGRLLHYAFKDGPKERGGTACAEIKFSLRVVLDRRADLDAIAATPARPPRNDTQVLAGRAASRSWLRDFRDTGQANPVFRICRSKVPCGPQADANAGTDHCEPLGAAARGETLTLEALLAGGWPAPVAVRPPTARIPVAPARVSPPPTRRKGYEPSARKDIYPKPKPEPTGAAADGQRSLPRRASGPAAVTILQFWSRNGSRAGRSRVMYCMWPCTSGRAPRARLRADGPDQHAPRLARPRPPCRCPAPQAWQRYCDTRTCVGGSESRNGFACSSDDVAASFSRSLSNKERNHRSFVPFWPLHAAIQSCQSRRQCHGASTTGRAFKSARWPRKSNSRQFQSSASPRLPSITSKSRVRWTDPNAPNAFARRSAAD